VENAFDRVAEWTRRKRVPLEHSKWKLSSSPGGEKSHS
jgi:hypothetical protein